MDNVINSLDSIVRSACYPWYLLRPEILKSFWDINEMRNIFISEAKLGLVSKLLYLTYKI